MVRRQRANQHVRRPGRCRLRRPYAQAQRVPLFRRLPREGARLLRFRSPSLAAVPETRTNATKPYFSFPSTRSRRVNNVRHRRRLPLPPPHPPNSKTQLGPRSQRTLMVPQGVAEALQAYTGLTPGAAATILALMLATYLLVSSLFVAPAAPSPAAPPKQPEQQREEERKEKEKDQEEEEAPMPFVFPDPVEVGEITLEQLRSYDGKDPAKQILIAIRGQVYDVSRGR